MAVVKSHTQTVSGISICGRMDRTPSVKHHTVYAYSAVQLAAIQQHTTQTHTLVSGQTASKRFKDLSFSTLHFTCILERNQETNTYLRIHCFFQRSSHASVCVLIARMNPASKQSILRPSYITFLSLFQAIMR